MLLRALHYHATRSVPLTGDDSPLVLWIVIMGVALVAIIAVVLLLFLRRKKGDAVQKTMRDSAKPAAAEPDGEEISVDVEAPPAPEMQQEGDFSSFDDTSGEPQQ